MATARSHTTAPPLRTRYFRTPLGLAGAAGVAGEQARLVGGLRHPVVTGGDRVLAERLRRLAPTYERLRAALEDGAAA
ncbi:hypothetical protein [Streptomyces sp. NPDC101132]|uniref:hypothetical protein n=1 Tax=Streptomyces sp. NPDC101132 TaxID=3366110 RepID=UPI0038265F40